MGQIEKYLGINPQTRQENSRLSAARGLLAEWMKARTARDEGGRSVKDRDDEFRFGPKPPPARKELPEQRQDASTEGRLWIYFDGNQAVWLYLWVQRSRRLLEQP